MNEFLERLEALEIEIRFEDDEEIRERLIQERDWLDKANYMADDIMNQLQYHPKMCVKLGAIFEEIAVYDAIEENRRIDLFNQLKLIIDEIVEDVEL